VNPSPFRIALARPSADQASISASRVWTSAMRGVGGGFGLGHQRGAFGIGGQHRVEQRHLGTRHLLRDAADAGAVTAG
jgi:hypothetical protein